MRASPTPQGFTSRVSLRHTEIQVYLLGGALGAALNMGAAWALHRWTVCGSGTAFFFSTLLNELFHYVYYSVVHSNEEIRFKTPPALHVALFTGVAVLSGLLLTVLLRFTSMPFLLGVAILILSLSALNTFFVRISTFGSTRRARVEYGKLPGDYYDHYSDPSRVGGFKAWYHRSRFRRLSAFVGEYYRSGRRMADLGCGDAVWNVSGIPLTGLDVNADMLRWARRQGRLRSYRVTGDLSRTGLPAASQDLVLMSEVLEHLSDPDRVLREVRRILSNDGVFLFTVPYDYFLGPFFLLFNLNCLYMWLVRGSLYHKYRCGHVNHFTRSRLRKVFQRSGFSVDRLFTVHGLLLYGAARKTQRPWTGKVSS